VRAAREDWFAGQLDLDPERLVFLDETAATTSMARRYGWAPRGERCRIAVPAGHWKTTTVIAGLRTTGLSATALLDGPVTGERFRAYVTQTLVPTLRRGDTVILDNLGAHKVAGIREAIEARLLYLPPYCLIPGFDGAVFSLEWKDALWARFSMGAPPRRRRSVERYSIVKRA
jgi:hypothetical protein